MIRPDGFARAQAEYDSALPPEPPEPRRVSITVEIAHDDGAAETTMSIRDMEECTGMVCDAFEVQPSDIAWDWVETHTIAGTFVTDAVDVDSPLDEVRVYGGLEDRLTEKGYLLVAVRPNE